MPRKKTTKKLPPTTGSALFDQRLRQLASFIERHGHDRIPGRFHRLSGWYNRIRHKYQHGGLSKQEIAALKRVGARLDPRFDDFKEKAKAYRAWKSKNDRHKNPRARPTDTNLAEWMERTYQRYWEDRLTDKENALVEELGLDQLGPRDRDASDRLTWEDYTEILREFYNEHGHFCVPSKGEYRLTATWLARARLKWREGRLDPEVEKELRRLGVPKTRDEDQWNANFQAYADVVAGGAADEDPSEIERLATWASRQRHARRAGKLKKPQIRALESIGFDWQPTRQRQAPPYGDSPQFNRMYRRLKRYYDTHGHTRIPARQHATRIEPGSGVDRELIVWLDQVRRAARAGKLSEKKRRSLREIEFPFKASADHF